ncbi:MAG: HAD family phosphatase [Actinoplanes sp.]
MVIRAVVFDVGGVLALCEPMDFDGRAEARFGLAGGAIGEMLSDVWADGAIGRATEADVERALRERLGLSAAQAEAVLADMWRQYLGVANTELIDYARGLRPAYRTAILSNSFVGAREREQSAYGFGDLVDDIIYSHEVGMSKPDPRLWELTCRRVGVAPSEMVFVDDAARAVEGAREFGIHGVLFEDTSQVVNAIDALLGR